MKRVLLHAGTHKTGTKSIQSFLNENRELLRSRGIYVPETGRRPLGDEGATPGHHLIPVAIRAGEASIVQSLLDELSDRDEQNVVLSSEEFESFYKFPELLAPLIEGLRSLHFQVTIALYVREQAGYAAAAYSEIVKGLAQPLRPSALVEEVLRTGGLHEQTDSPITFEYSRVIAGFSKLVRSDIVLRAFDARAEPAALLRDFAGVMSFLQMDILSAPLRSSFPKANQRMLFGHMLGNLHNVALATGVPATEPVALLSRLKIDPGDPIFKMPASLITRDERVAILNRFRADNDAVERTAGITIPHALSQELAPQDALEWVVPTRQRAIFDQVYSTWFE